MALSRSIKIGLAGALFSALVGPLLGAVVTSVAGAVATRQAGALLATAFYLFVAVVMFGPGALPAGFLVGYLAHRWAREGASAKKVIVKSTGTGAAAGASGGCIELAVSQQRTHGRVFRGPDGGAGAGRRRDYRRVVFLDGGAGAAPAYPGGGCCFFCLSSCFQPSTRALLPSASASGTMPFFW